MYASGLFSVGITSSRVAVLLSSEFGITLSGATAKLTLDD